MTKNDPKNNKVKEVDRFTEALMPESDERVYKFSVVFIIISLIASALFTTIVIVPEIILAKETAEIEAVMKIEEKKKEEKKEEKKKKAKKKRKKTGGGGKKRGKGTPNAPQSRGVLKLLTSRTTKSGFSAYSLMKNKSFAKDINKVLKNVAGLQKTGKTKLGGRRGKKTSKFNDGYAEGGSGGIGDMLSGLLGGGGGAVSTGAKGKFRAPSSSDIDMGQGGGNRSKSSIMRVVRSRSPGLRHIYNKYLKKHPGFAGKVNLNFTIAPSGKIIKIKIVGSSTGVKAFDNEVKNKVRRWKFERIKSGNCTITLPFAFSE
ncbi:MAG: TonB family protein [Fibrobacterales bacterium]